MAKGKVKLAFITQMARRKATYRKRKSSLIKKLSELTTLCGVDACAIIQATEFNPQPEYWPNRLEAERVIAKFKSLPPTEQIRNNDDLISYLQKRIQKTEKELKQKVWDNRQKELNLIMLDCLAGRLRLEDCKGDDREELGKLVDTKLWNVQKRIESLRVSDANQAGLSNAGAAIVGGLLMD